MHFETINTPGERKVRLAYLSKWPQSRGEAVGWLQLKKIGFPPGLYGPAYEKELPKLSKQFAAELLSDATITPSFVVVPSSDTKQFKTYLDELVNAKTDLPILDGAFTKPEGFKAGDKGRTFEEVLGATTLDASKLPNGADAVKRIWIIDDI